MWEISTRESTISWGDIRFDQFENRDGTFAVAKRLPVFLGSVEHLDISITEENERN